MKTRITELFGIQHPIIQGGMHYVGFAKLAAATRRVQFTVLASVSTGRRLSARPRRRGNPTRPAPHGSKRALREPT
jgi:NAD(P)H-dependent flavin oxidoreductase YrpB (nitropropane dioxygenase family)